MARYIRLVFIVALFVTGLIVWQILYGQTNSIYGTWDLGEYTDVELREDNRFAFYVQVGQLDQESLTGDFTYDESGRQIVFQRKDDAIFSWDDVSIEDNMLSFTMNGTRQTYARLGGITDRENDAANGENVLVVFPFNERLAEELSGEFDLPTWWNALKSFRNSHAAFEGAVLYQQAEEDNLYPYITADSWRNAVAYESFAEVFKTDAVASAGYVSNEDGPGVFQALDQRGHIPTSGDHVFALVVIDVPDDLIETYMSQWRMLSDFMANQDGFQGVELYRQVQGSTAGFEYFIRSAWRSTESFNEVQHSEFYKAIVTNPTYASRSALYSIAAQDL